MKHESKFPVKKALVLAIMSVGFSQAALATPYFTPGNLIVSETTYDNNANVHVGDQLSVKTFGTGGAANTYNIATNDGSSLNVFKNEVPDASFGVSSAITLKQITTSGALVNSLAIDSTKMTTSFASKSELALNVSTDGQSVSFMGYASPIDAIDVSNSNTAQAYDATNPVTTTVARAIGSVNLASGAVSITDVNAYSGNNGRAAIEANGQYYMVGNAGNGSANGAGLTALSNNTGVQTIAVGSSGNTTVVGAPSGTSGSSTGYQNGFSLAQVQDPTKAIGVNYAADKTGKDDNFRGETIFNNTLFVTKGSGSNGVDTVYQVGATGALANGGVIPANAAITILPGFNAISEKVVEAASGAIATANTAAAAYNTAHAAAIALGTVTAHAYQSPAASSHPFGIWFGDANTLFVADEGDGIRTDAVNVLNKVTTNAGLQEWQNIGGKWTETQIFQLGLVGQLDTAASAALGWSVQEDGLRNITGQKNADGSFTIYGTTSTVSNEVNHDLGADPNQIVAINIFANSTAANTAFTVLQTAAAGSRFGGVAIAPAAVPVPAAVWLFGTGLMGLFGAIRRRKAN